MILLCNWLSEFEYHCNFGVPEFMQEWVIDGIKLEDVTPFVDTLPPGSNTIFVQIVVTTFQVHMLPI